MRCEDGSAFHEPMKSPYFFILFVVGLGVLDWLGRLLNIQNGPRIYISFQSLGLIGAAGMV
ncbi:hypothetical protein D3C76_1863850 [compost metagenome]